MKPTGSSSRWYVRGVIRLCTYQDDPSGKGSLDRRLRLRIVHGIHVPGALLLVVMRHVGVRMRSVGLRRRTAEAKPGV
jgi:hypothetical protein